MDTIGKIERHFKALQENLNGSAGNAWRKLRREAFEAFTANGFPKMKDEEYKYTHIGKVIEKKFDFSGLASPLLKLPLKKGLFFMTPTPGMSSSTTANLLMAACLKKPGRALRSPHCGKRQ